MTNLENTKILIVDDEPINLQVISDCFIGNNLPYKILKAPNGKIALRLAESKLPNIVITDWDMPEMNGIELIKELKLKEATKDIPVIMCTGVMTTPENLSAAIQVGAVDFIRKPINQIELIARVRSMLHLAESYKKINEQKEEINIEKKKVEKLLIDSQLAFLRNQVSPHFLMNTLNDIHALIDIDAEEAQNSIIILSKLMRHLLYESEQELNPITIEIDFIRNYLDLMQLRFEEKVDIKMEVAENIPNGKIPPLLYTSLLENSFKHGIALSSRSYVHININFFDSNLVFEIKNGIPDKAKTLGPSGIGIENTRKRLELLYGNNCEFTISDANDIYKVRLTVPVQ